jgi:tetratricopeptide (TPR) repeat protein
MRWIFSGICLMAALSACLTASQAQQPEEMVTPQDPAASQAELELKTRQHVQARQDLDAGLAAFHQGNYAKAIDYFKNAIYLDESLATMARVQIAQAYAKQFKPGSRDPENLRMASQAIAQYREVLDQDPRNLESLKGIATLYTQTGDYEGTRGAYQALMEYTSDDPEPYYLTGVLDWTLAYADTQLRKSAAGLKVDDPLQRPEDQKLCGEIGEANTERVQEGLKMLQLANEHRPDYEETFAYFALLYQREADLACGDAEGRARSLKLMAEWADKALAVKNKKDGSGKTP